MAVSSCSAGPGSYLEGILLSNVYEIAYSEEDMNHKLEDGTQTLIGIALIFTGPVGAIVGGVALGVWEIYENYRDHQPVTAE